MNYDYFYNSRLLQLHTNNQMRDHSISLRLVKENGHPSIIFFFLFIIILNPGARGTPMLFIDFAVTEKS